MRLAEILAFAVKHDVSDVHLKVGRPPFFRRDGVLVNQKGGDLVEQEDVERWLKERLDPHGLAHFKQTSELDVAIYVEGAGRFRMNVFRQRGEIGMALRHIRDRIPNFDELNLPTILERVSLLPRGLVLVTGATGSGKSTTIASVIEYINRNRACHILTVEDPIEFLFEDKRALINQRQVGQDTAGFAQALRQGLRQDPDVILFGEIRDHDTLSTAIHAAETGHLVLGTLHTADAYETVTRVLSLSPPESRGLVRTQLSSCLQAVICQRLLKRTDGGRIPAVEVLVQTEFVRELIADAERTVEIPMAISQGEAYGMQTFDDSLYQLAQRGLVQRREALNAATRPGDLRMRFDGFSSG